MGIITCLNFQASAQQSIIPDISYLFLEKLIATAKQNYPRVKQLNINKDIAEFNVKTTKTRLVRTIISIVFFYIQ